MKRMAAGDVSPPLSRPDDETWSGRLRRLWMARRAAGACVLDGLTLHLKGPVAQLRDAAHGVVDGMVLLLDHGHPGALETLRTARVLHARPFDAGAIVVGIENLPDEEADALVAYRRAAGVPVFAVDLARAGDRLLLREALVATRVAAALHRDAARGSAHGR